MTSGDVRGACLALIKRRLGCTGMGTQPAALGWKLENGSVSAPELSALCAAWIGDAGAASVAVSAPRRWLPSPALRAFVAEYQRARTADATPPVAGQSARTRRTTARAADRGAIDCDS